MEAEYRNESDTLGTQEIPADALWGIHTKRAMENFPFDGRPVRSEMIRAYGMVKLACLTTCDELGVWKDNKPKVEAMICACREMTESLLDESIHIDLMQGGAGTSLNMNVNEVLANRSLQLMGKHCGDYDTISPNNDINRYQSTNDTFPTALKGNKSHFFAGSIATKGKTVRTYRQGRANRVSGCGFDNTGS
jgi:aspartate ammonia-lyase